MKSILKRLETKGNKKIQKILLADKDEAEFEKLIEISSSKNIRIEYIKDGELAYGKIIESQPELIIIDLIMQGVNGILLGE